MTSAMARMACAHAVGVRMDRVCICPVTNTASTPNETKVYIGDYAVITNGGGNPRKVEYLLKDRLGSVDAVASAAGAVTETRGYDAFGKPRSGTWADLNPAKMASTAVTPKGFTQHEHLNQLELIHMNGRVFDYNLGRFTGVDPFIQSPLNRQSLNPYSYILNNPLSGTDPTGYTSCSDVSTSDKGSGSCTHTTSDGKEHDVDYKVGKDGKVSISTSGKSFGAIAADNKQRGENGGAAPKGVTDAGRKEAAAAASEKGSASGKGMASASESKDNAPSLGLSAPGEGKPPPFSREPSEEYTEFAEKHPELEGAFDESWRRSTPPDSYPREDGFIGFQSRKNPDEPLVIWQLPGLSYDKKSNTYMFKLSEEDEKKWRTQVRQMKRLGYRVAVFFHTHPYVVHNDNVISYFLGTLRHGHGRSARYGPSIQDGTNESVFFSDAFHVIRDDNGLLFYGSKAIKNK